MNKNDLLGLIEKSPIDRWDGLRRRLDGSLVDIQNDDTLTAQLHSITSELISLAPKFNAAAQYSPIDVGIAYTGRLIGPSGIGGCNYLLNAQSQETWNTDAEILADHADELDKAGENPALGKTFLAVADALTGKNADLRAWIDAAKHTSYLRTGVEAAIRASWLEAGDPDREIYLDIACNAFNNNYRIVQKIDPDTAERIMAPIAGNEAIMAVLHDQDRYKRSVEKASTAAPSCNRQPS